MRVLLLLLIFLCGCFLREKPAAVTQECLLKSVLDRHLEGETASAAHLVGEAPDIAQTDGRTDSGKQEAYITSP